MMVGFVVRSSPKYLLLIRFSSFLFAQIDLQKEPLKIRYT